MYFVYEIVNSNEKIEYIGQTENPQARMKGHRKGLFKNRSDVNMRIVQSFETRKEALEFEGSHKIANGFEWTEKMGGTFEGRSKGGKNSIDNARTYLTKECLSNNGTNAIIKRKSNPEEWNKSLKNFQIEGGKAVGNIVGNRIHTCEKCGRTIKGPSYFSHIKKCN